MHTESVLYAFLLSLTVLFGWQLRKVYFLLFLSYNNHAHLILVANKLFKLMLLKQIHLRIFKAPSNTVKCGR